MENIKTIKVDFREVDNIVFNDNETVLLVVMKDNVKFEFLIKRKFTSEKLIVFGSGAYDNKKIELPVFQRYSWADEFDENLIYYNDPTLYLGDLTLAWGYGTEKHHYLETIAIILNKIMSIINVKSENVGIYGSSGGGSMAMVLATYIKGSTAIVNNPQTNISKYYKGAVKKLFSTIYPELEVEKALTIYKERVNVIELFKKENYIPNIVYYQNIACGFDMDNQFLPLINDLREINEEYFSQKISINLYSNKDEGHNPLSKDKTINLIKEALNLDVKKKEIMEIQSGHWREFSKRNGYSLFRYEVKLDRKKIGENYIVEINNKEINRRNVKDIDVAGFADIYTNGHLYISVNHKDISEDEIINEEKINKYFSEKEISIKY